MQEKAGDKRMVRQIMMDARTMRLLHVEPSTLNPSTNPKLSSLNPEPETLNPQPSTLNSEPQILNPKP